MKHLGAIATNDAQRVDHDRRPAKGHGLVFLVLAGAVCDHPDLIDARGVTGWRLRYWCALLWAAAAMAPAAPPALVKTQAKPEPEPEPEVGLSAAKKRRAVKALAIWCARSD
jgi:hypothetical protein